jgi:hypothetical protein
MQAIRLHDPARAPANWMQIVRPGQFMLFSKDLDSGAPCDLEGRPFADVALATGVLCDSMAEVRLVAEAAVARVPSLRIDVFDAEGRANPALLTVLHPARAAAADTHPRVLGRRRWIAWSLIAAAIPLLAYAIVERTHRDIILPAFLGLNMLLAAGRLLWFNLGVRETERARQERLRRHEGGTAAS